MSARVISFINYKGGVGKTTSTYHIGCALAQFHDQRVLMIDIDPQTNLTFLCVAPGKWERHKRRVGTIATLYNRFLKGQPLDVGRYVWHDPIGLKATLDLVPCDIDLLGEDLGGGQITGTYGSMAALRENARQYLADRSFMTKLVREVEAKYDFILIDCPPNLYLMTQNALVASDAYVVTAVPDHLSTIGLTILYNKVTKIGEWVAAARTFRGSSEGRPVAEFEGVVFVKVRIGGSLLTTTHANTMAAIDDLAWVKGRTFGTHTTELIGYSEAAENQVPVWMLDSSNARRAAHKNEYQDIAQEFLRRMAP